MGRIKRNWNKKCWTSEGFCFDGLTLTVPKLLLCCFFPFQTPYRVGKYIITQLTQHPFLPSMMEQYHHESSNSLRSHHVRMHPPICTSQEIQRTEPAVLVWASSKKIELTLREPKFKSFNKGREVQKAASQSNSLLNPACMTRPTWKNNMPCSYCFKTITKTSWRFQHNWKICSSNWIISTGRDEHEKHIQSRHAEKLGYTSCLGQHWVLSSWRPMVTAMCPHPPWSPCLVDLKSKKCQILRNCRASKFSIRMLRVLGAPKSPFPPNPPLPQNK